MYCEKTGTNCALLDDALFQKNMSATQVTGTDDYDRLMATHVGQAADELIEQAIAICTEDRCGVIGRLTGHTIMNEAQDRTMRELRAIGQENINVIETSSEQRVKESSVLNQARIVTDKRGPFEVYLDMARLNLQRKFSNQYPGLTASDSKVL